MRGHTGACSVQRKFANGDPHALGAEIAQAKDTLAVRNADPTHVRLRPVPQHFGHTALVTNTNEEALGPAVNAAKRLTCQSNSGRIHHRHVGFRVAHQDVVEEAFVALLEIAEVDVFVDRLSKRLDVAFDTQDLHVQRRDHVWQEPH